MLAIGINDNFRSNILDIPDINTPNPDWINFIMDAVNPNFVLNTVIDADFPAGTQPPIPKKKQDKSIIETTQWTLFDDIIRISHINEAIVDITEQNKKIACGEDDLIKNL